VGALDGALVLALVGALDGALGIVLALANTVALVGLGALCALVGLANLRVSLGGPGGLDAICKLEPSTLGLP